MANLNKQPRTFESLRWGPVVIQPVKYAKGGLAIRLTWLNQEMGFQEPLATLSVWSEDSPSLPSDEFFVKTWSENADIAIAAAASGWFEQVFTKKAYDLWRLRDVKGPGFKLEL